MKRRIAAIPTITEIFTMFEPKTFPTESAAPPEKAATKATVNSGNEVEKAIILNPTAVFPSWVTLDTFRAFFIARLLAQFNTTKETAIIMMLITKSVSSNSTMLSPSEFFPFRYPSL
jgi:hypothetical protein